MKLDPGVSDLRAGLNYFLLAAKVVKGLLASDLLPASVWLETHRSRSLEERMMSSPATNLGIPSLCTNEEWIHMCSGRSYRP